MNYDKRAIKCNLREPNGAASGGAAAYVVSCHWPRVQVLMRSRGGRWIERWQLRSTLTNFRVVTVPLDHPLYDMVSSPADPEGVVSHLERW